MRTPFKYTSQGGKPYQKPGRGNWFARDAFTLIELLVVVAIIAILASLLIPTIARSKAQGQKAVCVNNFRQLQLAWQLYTDDNNDTMPRNHLSAPRTGLPGEPNWVGGWFAPQLEYDNHRDNTNCLLLLKVEGGIGPYLKEAKVFKCPSDRSVAKIGGALHPRVRSVAMNHYMGSLFDDGSESSWAYQTLAQLRANTPREMGIVFIDTHEDSVATGMFTVQSPFWPAWNHFPASRHNGSATISFTDGHIISRRWIDSRTRRPMTGRWLYGEEQKGNPDIRWLQECATGAKAAAFNPTTDP